MSSTKFSVVYHEKMELNNAINKNIDIVDDSPILSYKISQEKAIQVSMVVDPNTNMLNKHVTIKCSTSNTQCAPVKYPNLVFSHSNNTVINIQLLYNLNTPMEPNLWNGNFHSISLQFY